MPFNSSVQYLTMIIPSLTIKELSDTHNGLHLALKEFGKMFTILENNLESIYSTSLTIPNGIQR